MPFFTVSIDRATPYRVEAVDAITATIDAHEQHPEAQRVEVSPVGLVREVERVAADTWGHVGRRG